MNINIEALDTQIGYLMHLQEMAKEKFGNNLYACSVKRIYTNGYLGMVELKDGKVYNLKAHWENPKFLVFSWKQVAFARKN